MNWGITEYGYEPKTTFWQDFNVADIFGADAIEDTFCRAFDEWKNDYIYLTELVMVLNWKTWQHTENNKQYAGLYNKLWYKADNYACNNLKGKELDYFIATTD